MSDIQAEANPRVMKGLLWTGPAMIFGLIFGQVIVMRFIPPPSPNLSAHDIAQLFIDHQSRIRVGSIIVCIFFSFWVTWAAPIIAQIRKMERGFPIITLTSAIIVGGTFFSFMIVPTTWAAMAFRPEAVDPATLRLFNDWVWFNYIFPWPPYSVLAVLIAIAIFKDKSASYPRWVGYLNLWIAVLIAPAALITFFKTGPMAWDGLVAFYIPMAVWFSWIVIMTVKTYQIVKRGERVAAAEAPKAEQDPELALSSTGA
jgi:hypothetical protein